MSEAVIVTRYRCSVCQRLQDTEKSADSCCTCEECGAKAEEPFGSHCPKHALAREIKRAREKVRSFRENLAKYRAQSSHRIADLEKWVRDAEVELEALLAERAKNRQAQKKEDAAPAAEEA